MIDSGTLCGIQRGPSRPLVTVFLWLSRDLGKGLWSYLKPGPCLLLGLLCCCCSVTLVVVAVVQSLLLLLCPTLCYLTDCSTPGFPVLHHLPEFAQTHVGEAIYLSLCRPLLLPPSIFPSIRAFSHKLALRIKWPKLQSFQRIFRVAFCLQLTGLKAQPLWSNSHPYKTAGKTIAFIIWTFVSKVMSLLFNTEFVTAFLPRSVFNFMATIPVPSDFGAQENHVIVSLFAMKCWDRMRSS